MTIKELKEEVYFANLEIPKRNLALYTWGNVSGFDRDKGIFAIKPSGISYEILKMEDMVVVSLENEIVEGLFNPSTDTPTHLELYRAFPQIGGICHTHSPYATAWAQSMSSVPILGTTHADYSPNPIPCTRLLTELEVNEEYERNTGKVIIEAINNPRTIQNISNLGPFPQIERLNVIDNPMMLVAGHGPFCWGKNASQSVYNSAVLEECCKMAMFVKNIRGSYEEFPQYIIDKHFQRKHGKNSYYGQK